MVQKIMMLLLALTTLASLAAIWNAHFATGGMTFGSTTGSLSLMAFAINSAVFMKMGKSMCSSCSKTN